MGFLAFVLLMRVVFPVTILFTDAYSAAAKFVTTDPALRSEMGQISGLGFISSGGFETESDNTGKRGVAQLNTILKGDKKYREVSIYVIKNPKDSAWIVEGVE